MKKWLDKINKIMLLTLSKSKTYQKTKDRIDYDTAVNNLEEKKNK